MKVKKLFSLLLAVLFVFPLACCAVKVSGVTAKITFDTADSLSSVSNVKNAQITYVASERAIRVRATGNAPSFSFVPASDGIKYGMAVITYRVDGTNSSAAAEGTLTVSGVGGPSLVTKTFSYVKGYKAYSAIVNVSEVKSFQGATLTVFNECEAGDYAFIYSIEFTDSKSEAEQIAADNALSANGDVISRYTEAKLKTNAYSWEEYMVPYWSTDLITNEAVYPLCNADGTINDATLMFSADRIVSVRDSYLRTEYKEGVDYELVNGKLRILKTGSIPTVKYTDHYFTSQRSNSYKIRNTNPARYVRFQEGPGIPSVQIAVTYTHSDAWSGFMPSHQGASLPNTLSKLENGNSLKIVFFGDSITNGGNSSGEIDMAPYAERWTVMFERELKRLYPGAAISCENTSVSGGSWSPEAVDNVQGSIVAKDPDLVVLALGTNDYQFQYSASKTYNSMSYVVDAIKNANPACEIILVAPMLSNPECFDPDLLDEYISGYRRKAAEYEGVVIADVNAVHKFLLTKKIYTDLSANNLCHLNDTLARVYGHVLIRTVTPDGASAKYKATASAMPDGYVTRKNYTEASLETIDGIIADAKAKINNAATFDEIMGALRDAKLALALVPNATDEIKAKTDYEKIVFDNAATLSLLSSTSYMQSSFSEEEGAVMFKSTSKNSDMRTTIVYPATKPVSASTNKYAVITYKVPATSGADTTQLFFCAGDVLSPAEAASVKFSPKKTGAFVSEVIDLSAMSWWKGRITRIRIDPFMTCAKGDVMYLYSLCLCPTASAASDAAVRMADAANGTAGAFYVVDYSSQSAADTISSPLIDHFTGDVNLDGKVSLDDLPEMKKLLSGSNDYVVDSVLFDVNRDGLILLDDLQDMKKLLAGVGSSEYVSDSCFGISSTYTGESVKLSPALGHYAVFTANGAACEYAVLTYKADKAFKADYKGGNNVTSAADGEVTFTPGDGVLFVMMKLPEKTDSVTIDVGESSVEVLSFAMFEFAEDAAKYAENIN